MPPKKKAVVAIPTTMDALREQLVKRYGDGRVMRREEVTEYEIISTGSLTLDYATRVGGWVRGRTHEIVGVEGVGKTTLAILGMIEAQQDEPDLAVGYIDMEQTFDYDWAEELGLDTSDERFVHIYPDNSEDVADQLKMQVRTGLFSMLVVDSIGGMESKNALEKDAGDVDMMSNAKVITRMVKAVAVLARKHRVAIIFINQLRANPNQGPDVSAGPKALKYNTTMKVDLRRASGDQPSDTQITMKFEDNPDPISIGIKMKARVVRNKVAPQGFSGEFWIFNVDTPEWGPIGINKADEALSIGVRLGIIEQGGGGNYTLPDGRKARGREKVMAILLEELDLVDMIREKALEQIAGDILPQVQVAMVDV